MKISFPTCNNIPGSIITLKLTKNNITEESRIPNLTTLEQDNQNFRDLLAKGTKCYQFENGNTLWLLKKENDDGKFLTIKDKNDKEIKKIELAGDMMSYSHSSSCEKYTAISTYDKKTKNGFIVVYSLPDLKKISSFEAQKNDTIEIVTSSSLFTDKGKIIIYSEGDINIYDIKTGQLEKSFVIEKYSYIQVQHQLDDGTFLSVLKNGVVCHWSIDGTIISKTKGEVVANGVISCAAHDKGVVTLYPRLMQQSYACLESTDEFEDKK